MRQVIMYPGEDGYWVVEAPSLPGCISQGKTREEALTNIKKAVAGFVSSLIKDGLSVPEERPEGHAFTPLTKGPHYMFTIEEK